MTAACSLRTLGEMRGIVGWCSYNVPPELEFVLQVLLNGPLRLEYRGYDSAGTCGAVVKDGSALSDGVTITVLPRQAHCHQGSGQT